MPQWTTWYVLAATLLPSMAQCPMRADVATTVSITGSPGVVAFSHEAEGPLGECIDVTHADMTPPFASLRLECPPVYYGEAGCVNEITSANFVATCETQSVPCVQEAGGKVHANFFNKLVVEPPEPMRQIKGLTLRSSSQLWELDMQVWRQSTPGTSTMLVVGGQRFQVTHLPDDTMVVGTADGTTFSFPGEHAVAHWLASRVVRGALQTNQVLLTGQTKTRIPMMDMDVAMYQWSTASGFLNGVMRTWASTKGQPVMPVSAGVAFTGDVVAPLWAVNLKKTLTVPQMPPFNNVEAEYNPNTDGFTFRFWYLDAAGVAGILAAPTQCTALNEPGEQQMVMAVGEATAEWKPSVTYNQLVVSVGDTVVFDYADAHNVASLPSQSCTAAATVLAGINAAGPNGMNRFSWRALARGTYYFTSTEADDCTQGQILEVVVQDGPCSCYPMHCSVAAKCVVPVNGNGPVLPPGHSAGACLPFKGREVVQLGQGAISWTAWDSQYVSVVVQMSAADVRSKAMRWMDVPVPTEGRVGAVPTRLNFQYDSYMDAYWLGFREFEMM